MNKRSSSVAARVFAVAALVAALVLSIALVGGAFDGGGSDGADGDRRSGNGSQQVERPQRKTPAVYVIESGDTLIGIAHRTGVPVAQIEALNPEVDPQILIAGEELKLR